MAGTLLFIVITFFISFVLLIGISCYSGVLCYNHDMINVNKSLARRHLPSDYQSRIQKV